MIAATSEAHRSVASAAESAVKELVRVKHWGDSSFINLPLIYPDGSHVTVKLDPIPGGFIRVSDNGFGYRLLENIGAQRSFPRAARRAAEAEELCVNTRAIYADVPMRAVTRAICDVGVASWNVVDRVFGRIADQESEEIEDHLRERLSAIFADRFVPDVHNVRGLSTTDWEVSAVVKTGSTMVIFQAVANHPHSINKASTSFLDLASLHRAPHLVAVVKDKSALGPKLALLGQAGGRVIEEAQPDETYRAVAA